MSQTTENPKLARLEAVSNPETAWADDVYNQLSHLENEDVVFDIDSTVYFGNLEGKNGQLRPGTTELFIKLQTNGNRIHLWSFRSDVHAASVARLFGLEQAGLTAGCYSKPLVTYEETGTTRIKQEVTLANTINSLGFIPAATVDDDPRDRIVDALEVQFVQVPPYMGNRVNLPALNPL